MKYFLLVATLILSLISSAKAQIYEVPYRDITLDCHMRTDSIKIIINSDDDLQQYTGCFMLDIALSEFTIIGISLSFSGDPSSIGITVLKDRARKAYYISASGPSDSGKGRMHVNFHRFVYMDKLEPDYEIRFKYNGV